jgi:hypothetical protein
MTADGLFTKPSILDIIWDFWIGIWAFGPITGKDIHHGEVATSD